MESLQRLGNSVEVDDFFENHPTFKTYVFHSYMNWWIPTPEIAPLRPIFQPICYSCPVYQCTIWFIVISFLHHFWDCYCWNVIVEIVLLFFLCIVELVVTLCSPNGPVQKVQEFWILVRLFTIPYRDLRFQEGGGELKEGQRFEGDSCWFLILSP